MKNETKLTAQDLALYLGAECEVKYDTEGFRYYKDNGIYLITGNMINEYGRGETNIKPILRPLSSITEAEMKENHEAYKAAASGLGKLAHGTAASTRHWLSLHIDLFGWIESGLAISRTFICQSEAEGNKKCSQQCDHCKQYFAPLEKS